VEFRDTDAAGIVHFSVFFTYMEQAEHALLRHLGIRLVDQRDGIALSWPRVAACCEYHRPIGFDDEIEIRLSVKRIGTKSVTYQCEFHSQGLLIASGHVTAACCRIDDKSAPMAIAIPEEIVQLLSPCQISDQPTDPADC
jgi:4-hydroxybenzoyl-CoA thioesterase/acyl-CoA thioester hydrolase